MLIGAGDAGALVEEYAKASGVAVVAAHLAPDTESAARLAGKRVFGFAGIGRPEKFFDTLSYLGADVAGARAFPDHHAYSPAELAQLQAQADEAGAMLITTEKDRARIGPACAIAVLPVSLETDDAGLLARLAQAALSGAPFKV